MSNEVIEYRLENLSCASCAEKFEKNLNALDSVEDVKLNFGASKLSVSGNATIEELEQAGAFDGIKVIPVSDKRVIERIPFLKRRENIISFISLLFLVPGVILSFIHDESYLPAIALFTLAIVVGGMDIFRTGIKNVVTFEFDIKALMSIAIIGAVIIGEWREAAIIVFLFAVSEALEAYSVNKARQSIQSLIDIAPAMATVKRNESIVQLRTEEIKIGDILVVKPGEKIAMDGQVLAGQSTINQAAITGESVPVFKQQGDEVFAGTLNEEGALEIIVTKLVGDTTLAKIIHLVEEAQAEKAPSQKFVDKFAKYYTPAIMIIAALVMVVPPLLGADWQPWIYQGLAVLVVGCPCALVISTPVAIVTAIGNAARQGVLIKGGVHLEETGHIKAMAFDKTGTLTKGYPEVVDFEVADGVQKESLLQAVRAIEEMSQHPLAKAIVSYVQSMQLEEVQAINFQSVTGKGAYGEVNGKKIYIGSIDWATELTTIPQPMLQLAEQYQKQGKSVMAIVNEQQFAGILTVMDPVREESRQVLQRLKAIGMERIVMLSGDAPATAKAIGEPLGMTEIHGGLMPDQKLDAIKGLSERYGRVAMVGDGVNDAPALAAASIGIAMGGAGTDAALETADIALMGDDLEKLPYTIALSRKTLRVIKENIAFALGLKVIALLLIIPGWLTLWIAIFADMGATLLVIFNSLRLMRIQK